MNQSTITTYRHNPRLSPWKAAELRFSRRFYPFFPALRSVHRLFQRPSPGKQLPSSLSDLEIPEITNCPPAASAPQSAHVRPFCFG